MCEEPDMKSARPLTAETRASETWQPSGLFSLLSLYISYIDLIRLFVSRLADINPQNPVLARSFTMKRSWVTRHPALFKAEAFAVLMEGTPTCETTASWSVCTQTLRE